MKPAPKVTFENKFPQARIALENIMEVGIAHVAKSLAIQIPANITEAELVDTGTYRRSWLPERRSDTEWIIGSPVEYGVYLEFGHYTRKSKELGGMPRSFVLARPHIIPAAKSVAARLQQLFREAR